VESGVLGQRHRLPILVGIVLLGFALRAWGLTWGLFDATVSRRPHPDEWPVYWLFHWFGANQNLDPCPTSKSACFFDWGMVYPYTAYAVHLLIKPFTGLVPAGTFGRQADMEFVWAAIAGRTASLILSTLTIILVYRIASEAFSPDAGLAAALVTALSTLLVQLAHFATPDSTTIFLLSATLLVAVQLSRRPTIRRFALAGTLLGLSTGSEYHMALLVVPLGVAWWLGDAPRRARYLGITVLCALATYLVTSLYAVVHLSDFIAATEHTLRIRTVDSKLQYGDRWSVFGPAWLYVIRYPLGYGVGFAFTAWMLAGTGWSLLRRTRADWILLSWLVVYFVLVSLSPAKFMRYSAPLLPVLAVFSGRILVDLIHGSHVSSRVAASVLATLAVLITLLYNGAYASLFTATDSRLSTAQWLTRHAPTGSDIVFDQLPNGLVNLPYYISTPQYHPCFSEFQTAGLHNPARYVVTDNYDLEEHPRITQAAVILFHRTLQSNPSYRLVWQVHHVPTFLGMTFSIDGSPHDWRYPSHVISVYEKRPAESQSDSKSCFPTLAAAHDALYPPTTAN
jgi:hypothetical protein